MGVESTRELFGEHRLAVYQDLLSLRPVRNLYDWYRSQYEALGQRNGTEESDASMLPIVLDASDVIQHPKVVWEYAKLIGLNTTKVRSEWNAFTPEQFAAQPNEMVKVFARTLTTSTGLVKERAPVDVDIEVEAKQWREQWGEEVAKMLEDAVKEAMPDYEYLVSKRLRPS